MLRKMMDFFVRPIADPAIEQLYRACVAQARQPAFYAELHAPDTVDGRFDLLILHVLLVILRLQDHPPQTQQLFDILFADMDKNLREMGVSDVSIAKKMKPMLAAFYGRARAYEDALKADGAALDETLRRNIYGKTQASDHDAARLCAYVRRAHADIIGQNTNSLLSGRISFPTVI